MTRSVWLAFIPRDTVFIRDGRSFDAGSDNSAQAVWPTPSTVAGAVGAAFGREPLEVRGPVLARRTRSGSWVPHFRTPADLVTVEDTTEVVRLRPQALPEGVVTDLPEMAHWLGAGGRAGMGKQWDTWLSASAMSDYLQGRLATSAVDSGKVAHEAHTPAEREPHVGLARTSDRTARSGYLYRAAHLRVRDGWGFLAECVVPDGWNTDPAASAPFGGRGRHAWVETAKRPVRWPGGPEAFPGGRVAVYAATPALWPDGWRLPALPDGATVVAAAVGDPEPTATATPQERRRPANRMLRWAVPAGSVYCVQFEDAAAAAAWARDIHGTAYGHGQDDRLRTAGFGVVLTGVWT
ncbi:type III-B CRISPR module-associated Cmr3 family protein [Streptomyces sp. NPDC003393]